MSCNHPSLCSCCHGLNAWALGSAFGVVWALNTMILGIIAWQFHHGNTIVAELSSIYWGYEGTFIGVLFGTFWGAIDGFITGALVAWLYNLYVKHCSCKCTCAKEAPKV